MSDNISAGLAERGIEDGFIGFMVRIYEPDIDFSTCFAEVTSRQLARELAEIIRPVYPSADVTVVPMGMPIEHRAKAEESTIRMKIRMTEACESVNPGQAFLDALAQSKAEPQGAR